MRVPTSHLGMPTRTPEKEGRPVTRTGNAMTRMRAAWIPPKRSLKRTFRVSSHTYTVISFIASKIGRYGSGGKVYTGGDDESYNSIGGGSSPSASYNDSYGGNTDRYPNQRQGGNQQQGFR